MFARSSFGQRSRCWQQLRDVPRTCGYSANLMPYSSTPSDYVSRYATATLLATVGLIASAVFVIRAPKTGLAPTGNVGIYRLENGSGAQVGACFDNGSCRFSGSLLAKSTISGTTLFTGGTPVSRVFCMKSNGALGYCSSLVGAGGDCTCN